MTPKVKGHKIMSPVSHMSAHKLRSRSCRTTFIGWLVAQCPYHGWHWAHMKFKSSQVQGHHADWCSDRLFAILLTGRPMHFYCATHMHSAYMPWQDVCLSVCLSVTRLGTWYTYWTWGPVSLTCAVTSKLIDHGHCSSHKLQGA